MQIIFFVISSIINLRNKFSSKQYKTHLVKKVILIYRSNPEIVIHDYYMYVLDGLLQALGAVTKFQLVFFECPGIKILKYLLPFSTIFLQIEHTLFRRESKNSYQALSGNLPVPHVSETYLIRINDFEKLNQANIIFDYSRINLLNIRSVDLLGCYYKKTFCISPALYSIQTSMSGRAGVITLFGNLELPRRKIFLENLKKNDIDFKNISGTYRGVEKIYQKAKIVLNIRQTDGHDTLEELRVLPALRSGAIVISERAPYAIKTRYARFIIWGSIEEIPELVKKVESNYEFFHQKIFGDGSDNSLFKRRMARIEWLNQLSIQKAVTTLNH